jgi:hypothetical protein
MLLLLLPRPGRRIRDAMGSAIVQVWHWVSHCGEGGWLLRMAHGVGWCREVVNREVVES